MTDLVQQKAKSLQALLEVSKKQIEAALPRHLTPERLLRIAMTEARKNPALLECTQASFIGAIIQTAQLGLEPGGILGHSYLVPFKNKKRGITEVQLIVGYKGMMDLAYRSPKVSHVIARAVYEGDKFSYQYGTDERLEHVPDPEAMGKKLTHVYAVAFLREGGKIFDVMEAKEIESARQRSKTPDSGPWETDFESMAKKSVVRRMFRFMPVSIELQNAVGIDEAGDRGEQDFGSVIETTGGTVPPSSDKTDEFKKNFEQGPPQQAPAEQEAEPEPDTFGAAPGGGVPVDPPKKEKAPTKGELVSEMMRTGARIGLSARQLGDRCKKQFKCDPSAMSVQDLTAFNAELAAEARGAK